VASKIKQLCCAYNQYSTPPLLGVGLTFRIRQNGAYSGSARNRFRTVFRPSTWALGSGVAVVDRGADPVTGIILG